MRPPVLPSGNLTRLDRIAAALERASMRPPVLPSGNPTGRQNTGQPSFGFNEAAGFTQRKLPCRGSVSRKP